MTRSNYDDEMSRAIERLKEAYEDVKPSNGVRFRVYSKAMEKARGRRWGRTFVLCAASAAAATAVTAFFLFQSPHTAEQQKTVTPAKSDRLEAVIAQVEGSADLFESRGSARPGAILTAHTVVATSENSGSILRVGPHRVELGAQTRMVLERIENEDVEFVLDKGSVKFDVTPLQGRGRFSVSAGSLLVEVVGTVFSVERDLKGARVAVERGTVRTTFEGKTDLVREGENREFRESQIQDESEDAGVPVGSALDSKTPGFSDSKGAPRRKGSAVPPEPPRTQEPSSQQNTEEETLYRKALDLRAAGDDLRCSEAMREYVSKYPEGMFAQEALFALVRLDYRADDAAALSRDAAVFLERSKGIDAKTAEVRLLYAEVLTRKGDDPRSALKALSPLAGSMDQLPQRYQERASYILARAAFLSGEVELLRGYATSYLALFPDGAHATEVRGFLQKGQ